MTKMIRCGRCGLWIGHQMVRCPNCNQNPRSK
jgi:hypothetical protein